MKILFLGTPDFAKVVLQEILAQGFEVVGVVTQPDKPGNRNEIVYSQVKVLAIERGLPVYQFKKIREDGIITLKSINADVYVTCAYGQILSQEVLDIPRLGVWNVHASLLPKYRGSSPIQWSIIKGEAVTGVTIMKTALGIDCGEMLLQKKVAIEKTDTAQSLFDKLAKIGGTAICDALPIIASGNAAANLQAQDEREMTHFPMLRKEDGKIDFSKTAAEIDCLVRGYNPWPSAYTFLQGKRVKIFATSRCEGEGVAAKFGEVVSTNGALIVRVGDGLLRIDELQIEGGRKMCAREFLLGRKIDLGTILED